MYIRVNPNQLPFWVAHVLSCPRHNLMCCKMQIFNKGNLSCLPHRSLFFPIPKWAVIIVVSFPSSTVGKARNCLCTTNTYQICKTTYVSVFIREHHLKAFCGCAMSYYTMKKMVGW